MLKISNLFKLLVLLSLFLGGCSHPKFPRQESLIVALPLAPILLDPRLSVDAEGQKISALLYDGLVTFNDKQEPTPLLALRWEKVSPLQYRFFLRRGVLFSNGQELKAKDVICTYQFIQDPKNQSPLRNEFEKFEAATENDEVVSIKLKEPYAPFFVLLKKGIVSCDSKSGSGPYLLESFEENKRVVLRANINYFGGAPKLKYLIFDVVKDDVTRVLKLMKKEADLVQNGIPALLIKKVLENKKIDLMETTGTTFAYLGINLKDEILKNQKVRQAIAYAIDRAGIIEYLWKGRAKEANSLLHPNHWAFAADVKTYEHNPALARKLLEEAGIKDPIHLNYKTSTNKERIEIAKLIAQNLEDVGIKVTVQPFEWGTFFRDIRSGNYQLYSLTWVGVSEPDLYYSILHSSQVPPTGSNRNFFINKKADELTSKGRAKLEKEERRPLYQEIQRLANEELPFVPLWYENNIIVFWKDLKGVEVTPTPDYRNFMKIYR